MKIMDLAPGVEAVDLALHLPEQQTLVVADIHLGFEADLINSGTLIPRTHFKDLQSRLLRAFDHLGITSHSPYERIIVNGDLSHQFGYLTFRELEESSLLLKFLREYFNSVILIEGNHDGSLKPLHSFKESVYIGGSFQLGPYLFLHGDAEPKEIPDEINTLIIGHEHPAVGLRDVVTGRVEPFKCYLVGEYNGLGLIVLPSLNPLSAGTDLTREQCLSPLLGEDRLGECEVYAISDEGAAFGFGKLQRLIEAGEMLGGEFASNRDRRT